MQPHRPGRCLLGSVEDWHRKSLQREGVHCFAVYAGEAWLGRPSCRRLTGKSVSHVWGAIYPSQSATRRDRQSGSGSVSDKRHRVDVAVAVGNYDIIGEHASRQDCREVRVQGPMHASRGPDWQRINWELEGNRRMRCNTTLVAAGLPITQLSDWSQLPPESWARRRWLSRPAALPRGAGLVFSSDQRTVATPVGEA